MSRRSRPIKVRLHVHCESCYSRRCRTRVEPSVSCALKACRLLCGAVFHLCKEEEHSLLCPNERVPCLNAQYGCPLATTRAGRAAHLRTCRASVVCCSMAWLRWPTDDTHPHHQTTLQEKVLEAGGDPGQGGALDLSMALADQSDLYKRLKMKPLFPELMEEEEEQVEEEEEQVEEEEEQVEEEEQDSVEVGRRETANQAAVAGLEESSEEGTDSKGAEGQRSCAAGVNKERRDLCEMMFSMEKGGCTAAQAAQSARREEAKTSRGGGGNETAGKDVAEGPAPDHGKTGLAPWQAGVLERLKVELTPQEYNMYLVHHGRMLLSFGQIDACTPRERDFVYGSLEPIPVQTLHSFKVPVSYRHKRREKMYDTIARVQSETTAVDTSDLAVKEEDWQSDEAEATLLGYAELEVMGHKISEAKGTDGLYVDEGTQTHSFRTAPFTRNVTLTEVTPERPAKLRLQLRSESVSSRHNMTNSVFTFMCGHSFHRTELPTHFRNVHSDIQTCVSGWFEQRCPLAYLGCTYSQRRFQPSTHEATVTYNQEIKCFNMRPTISPGEGSPTDPPTAQRKRRGGGEDSLSTLPHEVLHHVASFLDSLSLSQLALVSRLLRDVCSSLLQDRGMVSLRWEKIYSHGGAKWRATPVWEFSHLFSRVDSWRFADVPPISAHLKVCPFYTPTLSQQPVPLPSMREKHGGTAERKSLVDQFTANRHNNN